MVALYDDEVNNIIGVDGTEESVIHTIQSKEGYTPCFGESNGTCPHTDCCFRDGCLRTKS